MNTLFALQPPYAPPKVKLLPLRDQPAYRVTQNTASCSLVELLAAVIGGAQQIETSEALLARFSDLRSLSRAHVAEIASITGIGQPTAVRIKAALALSQRLLAPDDDRPHITSPADAAAMVQYEMSVLEQEYLKVFLLDTRNRVLRTPTIYFGSLNTSVIRVGELFRAAISENTAALIVAHNHPSGDPSPSPEDINVTRQIVEAGKLLDVDVLDHIVIGHNRFVSLKQRGLGFDR